MFSFVVSLRNYRDQSVYQEFMAAKWIKLLLVVNSLIMLLLLLIPYKLA
jgi:hypothetical protein